MAAENDSQEHQDSGLLSEELIVSALVLVVLIGGAWFIYKDGFRGADEAPKAVGTPVAGRTRRSGWQPGCRWSSRATA